MVGVGSSVELRGETVSQEVNALLRGGYKWKTFAENMANVSIVAAAVRYFLNLASNADWKFRPASDHPEGRRYAELLEETREDLETTWARVVRRAVMYRFMGFSVQEWATKRRSDGVVTFADIEPRAQKTITRWERDPETKKIEWIVQQDPSSYKELWIPRWKTIYLVDDSMTDSPEGLGLLRHVAWDCHVLNRLEQLENMGFENNLEGTPIIRMPIALLDEMVAAKRMTPEKRDEAHEWVKKFLEGHVKSSKRGLKIESDVYRATDDALTPSSARQWDADVMQGESTGLLHANVAINRRIHGIARVLGVEELLLGETRGTQALSKNKSHNFYLTVDGSLKEVAEQMHRSYRNVLWALNGWPEDLMPEMVPQPLKIQDVEEISAALRDIATAAGPVLSIEDTAVKELFELMGLTAPDPAAGAIDASLRGGRRAETEGQPGLGRMGEGAEQ